MSLWTNLSAQACAANLADETLDFIEIDYESDYENNDATWATTRRSRSGDRRLALRTLSAPCTTCSRTGDWSMAAATTMEYTFVGAATIKRVIGDLNTDDVTTMEGMFAGEWADERKLKLEWGEGSCHPIRRTSNADTTATGLATTGASTVDEQTPKGAKIESAGSNIISDWSTTAATTMENTFEGTFEFNQLIGDWNPEAMTMTRRMLNIGKHV